jgi:putative FmdB family regulatory protein
VPTYDYICSACGHRMEVVHGIHGQGPESCPVCGGTMRKAFVAPAVHFKGSGWAKKDRAAGAKKTTAKAAAGGDEGGSRATAKAGDPGTTADPTTSASAPASSGSTGGDD